MSTFVTRSGPVSEVEALRTLIASAANEVDAAVVVVFSPPSLESSTFTSCAESFPFPVAFTTTAGHFTHDGRCDDEVVVCAIGGATVLPTFCGDMRLNPAKAAQQLASGFHEMSLRARKEGRARSSTLVLTDGLSNTGEPTVDALRRATRPHQIIAGGAAGDNGAFESTRVGLDSQVSDTGAVALHVFDSGRFGVGLGHGFRPATKRMTVTEADGPLVQKIDGKPAFDAYREFAKARGEDITPETVGTFMIRHEIGVYFFDDLRFARAPLSVTPNGELFCAAGLRAGSTICILDGEDDSMVAAAKSAAQEARDSLGGQEVAGVLVFDCICRGLLLGDGFQAEIDAIEGVFPGVPLAGFLTYGEIARYGGKLQGWHNATAVVVAIPA